jgi:hypothetical protein
MDAASQQADQQGARGAHAALWHDDALPAMSIHFAVPAAGTFTWRVRADSTLRVDGTRIWLTRARSPYDHWLDPGDLLRVYRGERLWLSTDNESASARVTLTSAWQPPFVAARRAAARFAARLVSFPLRLAR